jgi:hypothetical protein
MGRTKPSIITGLISESSFKSGRIFDPAGAMGVHSCHIENSYTGQRLSVHEHKHTGTRTASSSIDDPALQPFQVKDGNLLSLNRDQALVAEGAEHLVHTLAGGGHPGG